MKPNHDFTSKLKQTGIRVTPQRMAIYSLLMDSKNHPTALMIYQQIRENFPSISLMTVYNTLNMLADRGLINVLGHAGDDSVHYDADIEPHVNLACISCHNIVDIKSKYVNQMTNEINSTSGYQLFGARVLFYGNCPACQNQSRSH